MGKSRIYAKKLGENMKNFHRIIDNMFFYLTFLLLPLLILAFAINLFAGYQKCQTAGSETGWVQNNSVSCFFSNPSNVYIGFTGEY